MDEQPALDALVRQLQQSAEINDELRLLLKEDRQRLALSELETAHLRKHLQGLEAEVIGLRNEVARLTNEYGHALASLASIGASRLWRVHERIESLRAIQRSFGRLIARGRGLRR